MDEQKVPQVIDYDRAHKGISIVIAVWFIIGFVVALIVQSVVACLMLLGVAGTGVSTILLLYLLATPKETGAPVKNK